MTNCKCGAWLEPEFDEFENREQFLWETLGAFGVKVCRVCEERNIFIEKGFNMYREKELTGEKNK